MRLGRWVLVVSMTLVFVLTGGCGSDRPGRAAFIDHMASVSASQYMSSPAWKQIWGCTYDRVSDDDLISRLMDLKQGERPPANLSAAMSKALVQCAGVDSTTTTVPAMSTGATTSTSAPP